MAGHAWEVPRADIARELDIDEKEIVGYLGSMRYVEFDIGWVHLTPRGVEHLRSLGRCASPKGIEGRPNREEIEDAAACFIELLYDRPLRNRGAASRRAVPRDREGSGTRA